MYDKAKKNKKISLAMKGIKRSQETKDKISKALKGRIKGPRSQETKDKISKTMKKKAPKGKSHYRTIGSFKLIVESTKGEIKEHLFDGNTPIQTCCKRFNLGGGDVLYKMKYGFKWTIRRRSKQTLHKWPIGTTISMELL